MAMFFVMAWRGYKKSLSAGDNAGSGLMLGTVAALVGFSASSLVNYNFGDSEPLLMLLSVVALYLVASAGFEPQRAQTAQRSRDRETERRRDSCPLIPLSLCLSVSLSLCLCAVCALCGSLSLRSVAPVASISRSTPAPGA